MKLNIIVSISKDSYNAITKTEMEIDVVKVPCGETLTCLANSVVAEFIAACEEKKEVTNVAVD